MAAAVCQPPGPKPGQAHGRSPGLGDQRCCHSQRAHCLPLNMHHPGGIVDTVVMTVRLAWPRPRGRSQRTAPSWTGPRKVEREEWRTAPLSLHLLQPKCQPVFLCKKKRGRNPAKLQQPDLWAIYIFINTCLPLQENNGHLMPICSLSKRQTDVCPPGKSDF